MGVVQLWQILEPVKRTRQLQDFKGKTLAVDLSAWIVDSNSVRQMQGSVVKPHLRNLFFRVSHLLSLEITPVFVLEGRAPELKLETLAKRNQAKYGRGGASVRSRGLTSRSQLARVIRECCEMLDYLGLPYVESEGEAEAMCAYLNQEGLVDACITQDGDAFLYGARTVLRNFTVTGKDPVIELYDMRDIQSRLCLDREKLVGLALLLGCDYAPKGVPGVGKEQVMKMIQGMKDQRLLERLDLWRSDSYLKRLEMLMSASKMLPHCKNCGHPGSSREHESTGCSMCHSLRYCEPRDYDYQCACAWHQNRATIEYDMVELSICRKARMLCDFPDQKIIEEFMISRNSRPKTMFVWSRPRLEELWTYNLDVLTWPEAYTTEKVIPLISMWDMRDIKRGRFTGHLIPNRIVKTRVKQCVSSYEVEWEKLALDANTESNYYVTIEEQELFTSCFPDVVAEFDDLMDKKAPKRRAKKKAASSLVDNFLCEALSQGLRLVSDPLLTKTKTTAHNSEMNRGTNLLCSATAETTVKSSHFLDKIVNLNKESAENKTKKTMQNSSRKATNFSDQMTKERSENNVVSQTLSDKNNFVQSMGESIRTRNTTTSVFSEASLKTRIFAESLSVVNSSEKQSAADEFKNRQISDNATETESEEENFDLPLSQRLARNKVKMVRIKGRENERKSAPKNPVLFKMAAEEEQRHRRDIKASVILGNNVMCADEGILPSDDENLLSDHGMEGTLKNNHDKKNSSLSLSLTRNSNKNMKFTETVNLEIHNELKTKFRPDSNSALKRFDLGRFLNTDVACSNNETLSGNSALKSDQVTQNYHLTKEKLNHEVEKRPRGELKRKNLKLNESEGNAETMADTGENNKGVSMATRLRIKAEPRNRTDENSRTKNETVKTKANLTETGEQVTVRNLRSRVKTEPTTALESNNKKGTRDTLTGPIKIEPRNDSEKIIDKDVNTRTDVEPTTNAEVTKAKVNVKKESEDVTTFGNSEVLLKQVKEEKTVTDILSLERNSNLKGRVKNEPEETVLEPKEEPKETEVQAERIKKEIVDKDRVQLGRKETIIKTEIEKGITDEIGIGNEIVGKDRVQTERKNTIVKIEKEDGIRDESERREVFNGQCPKQEMVHVASVEIENSAILTLPDITDTCVNRRNFSTKSEIEPISLANNKLSFLDSRQLVKEEKDIVVNDVNKDTGKLTLPPFVSETESETERNSCIDESVFYFQPPKAVYDVIDLCGSSDDDADNHIDDIMMDKDCDVILSNDVIQTRDNNTKTRSGKNKTRCKGNSDENSIESIPNTNTENTDITGMFGNDTGNGKNNDNPNCDPGDSEILSQSFFNRLENDSTLLADDGVSSSWLHDLHLGKLDLTSDVITTSRNMTKLRKSDRKLGGVTNLLSESLLSKDINELMDEVEGGTLHVIKTKKIMKKKRGKKDKLDDVIAVDNDKCLNNDVIVSGDRICPNDVTMFSDSFLKELAGESLYLEGENSPEMSYLNSSKFLSPLTPAVRKPRSRNRKKEKIKATFNSEPKEMVSANHRDSSSIFTNQSLALKSTNHSLSTINEVCNADCDSLKTNKKGDELSPVYGNFSLMTSLLDTFIDQ